MNYSSKNTLCFTLIVDSKEYRIQTFEDQYYSLMELISVQTMISGFGFCSGMGSCGTCLVNISEDQLASPRQVLACDIKVNDELANTIITIPEKVY